MWPFGKKKGRNAPKHLSKLMVTAPSPIDIKRQAVREAISALGLIKPNAEETIVRFLDNQMEIHPQQTMAGYRKGGAQISREQKKALGLRSNAFLSQSAYEDLTEAGCLVPLRAHETVLLRATFTYMRYRSIQSIRSSQLVGDKAFRGMKYMVLNLQCPICGPLDGKTIPLEETTIFPFKGCSCETANWGYQPVISFLGSWNE